MILMPKRDYYEVLGVGHEASLEEIKKAYRKLAKQFHPDRDGGDAVRFKEATEAYEILSDPEKRRQYDHFGHAGPEQSFDFGPTDFSRARSAFEEFGFGSAWEDIFDTFFGEGMRSTRTRQRRRSRAQPGEDLEYRLRITLEDAALGTRMKVTIPRYTVCERCQGSGREPGTSVETCPVCKGQGQLEYHQRTMLGNFVNVRPCERCGGFGEIVASPCKRCSGQGRVHEQSRLSIRIPPGVDTGSRLRVQGEGNAGLSGGPPGDLYIVVEVAPHDRFTRKGDDLYVQMALTFSQAALGARLKVPTLTGQEDLQIPAGTQSGETFRLKGQGITHLRGHGRGDLIVEARVVTPNRLTRRQRELLEELDRELRGER